MSIIGEMGADSLGERFGAKTRLSGVIGSSMTLASPQTSMSGEPKGIDVASGPFRILFSSSSTVPQVLRAIVSTVSTHPEGAWKRAKLMIEFKSSLALADKHSILELWALTLGSSHFPLSLAGDKYPGDKYRDPTSTSASTETGGEVGHSRVGDGARRK